MCSSSHTSINRPAHPKPDSSSCATLASTRYYWHTQEDNIRARVLYDKVARYNGFIRYVYPL